MNINPFQGSYLFNYSFTPTPNADASDDSTSQDPTTKDSGTKNRRQAGGRSESKTYLDEQLKARLANEQRKRKQDAQKNQSQDMNEMLQQLSKRQQEVNQLKRQLDTVSDPALRQQLQEQYGGKSQQYANLESQVSLLFAGPGGGFVGSEGKIDHIGSFVTST